VCLSMMKNSEIFVLTALLLYKRPLTIPLEVHFPFLYHQNRIIGLRSTVYPWI
jgi:hypothetical protein